MPVQGKARVGHKAPDFRCDAVVDGAFAALSLDTYIKNKQWLVLHFIPAAFSFVCPTEVLAFHNCIDEFIERNCAVAFVSTDSKHSLWQWQNLPRKIGGLGKVRVPLLSDQSHQMSRDYGVLLEKTGMDLRGSYIIDPQGIIQQVTINNVAVGRSVLEALRLVEAFQSVVEKGVLCPANWKPGEDTLDETYESRDELLSRTAPDELQVKNLDANVMLPFNLVMPGSPYERRQRRTAPTAGGPPRLLVSESSSTSKHSLLLPSSMPQSITSQPNNGVVTLDFADPLGSGGVMGSPHEFVSLEDEVGQRKDAVDGTHSRNISAGPMGFLGQRTVDALKRWSTPLNSPRLEPRSIRSQADYFD